MKESEIERIAANEKEWRRHIIRDLNDIKKVQIQHALKVNTLENKMTLISFIAGLVGSFIVKLFSDKGG